MIALEIAATAAAAMVPAALTLHRVHAALGKLAAVAPAAPAPAVAAQAPAPVVAATAPAPLPVVAATAPPPALVAQAAPTATRRVKSATHNTGTRHHGAKCSMTTDGTWLHVTEGGATKSYPLAGIYWLELAED